MNLTDKKIVYKNILKDISFKIEILTNDLASVANARDSDTKSSVGDKHETSRARLQIEIDQLNKQLFNLNKQKQIVNSINIDLRHSLIGLGSLVETSVSIFFISIGLGKIKIEGSELYAISSASPIGQLLIGKKKSDIFVFRNVKYEILEVH